ncbi:MAG TPA: hypothetical protein VK900_06290 [Anaerolineales bacterium]|nr:hypothetical protein [Anaerolineales bacterium]
MANRNPSPGDRYAEISVVMLTVVALLAGWLLKYDVEHRSVPFEAAEIRAAPPKGWLQAEPVGDEVLHITDFSSPYGFGTVYILRKVPIGTDATSTQVSSLVALQHGQNLAAFRVLDQREVKVYGRDAYELNYVFVEANPDVTQNDLPDVVRGVDYIFLNGDHAIVASFQADERNYEVDLRRFQYFLESVSF